MLYVCLYICVYVNFQEEAGKVLSIRFLCITSVYLIFPAKGQVYVQNVATSGQENRAVCIW